MDDDFEQQVQSVGLLFITADHTGGEMTVVLGLHVVWRQVEQKRARLIVAYVLYLKPIFETLD